MLPQTFPNGYLRIFLVIFVSIEFEILNDSEFRIGVVALDRVQLRLDWYASKAPDGLI
jgi:hypothetical protein